MAKCSAYDVKDAARQVAEDAWANAWAKPHRSDVAKLLGLSLSAMELQGRKEIIADEFMAIEAQQLMQIVATSHRMAREFLDRRIPPSALNRAHLFMEIGAKYDAFRRRLDGAPMLNDAVKAALDLFSQAIKGELDIDSLTLVSEVTDDTPTVQCRCCIQWLGPDSINGYAPDCWAEYQERVRIDEQAANLRRRAAA